MSESSDLPMAICSVGVTSAFASAALLQVTPFVGSFHTLIPEVIKNYNMLKVYGSLFHQSNEE